MELAANMGKMTKKALYAVWLLFFEGLAATPAVMSAAELKQATVDAFVRYVQLTEAR